MELLDILEQRVADLVNEILSLREENRRLRDDAANAWHQMNELGDLQQELEQERQLREESLGRVNNLLQRIQERLPKE